MPTPAQAKVALRAAAATFAERRLLVIRLKDDAKTAAADLANATREADLAERDLLAAADGSQEDADAAARLSAWLARLEAAEDAVAKVKDTTRRAQIELDAAVKVLRGARGDVRALHAGRQAIPKPPKDKPS